MKLLATIIVIIVGMDSVLSDCEYLPRDHVVCDSDEILEDGKTDCQEIRGDVVIKDNFPDDVQQRFHAVRLIRGRIWIENVLYMENLTAFNNVWDIEINDPVYNADSLSSRPGFLIRGCLELKEIDLRNLCSFTSTHYTGFSIRGNGEYKMEKKDWEFLRKRVGSRNMVKDIDRAPNPKPKKDNEMAKGISYGISAILGLITIAIIGSLVHFYTLTNRSTDQMEYLENLLNGTGEDNRENGYNRIRARVPKIKSERDGLFEE